MGRMDALVGRAARSDANNPTTIQRDARADGREFGRRVVLPHDGPIQRHRLVKRLSGLLLAVRLGTRLEQHRRILAFVLAARDRRTQLTKAAWHRHRGRTL